MAAPDQSLLPAPRDAVVHAVGIPNPFSREKVYTEIRPGLTLAEILTEIGLTPHGPYSVEVTVGGKSVATPWLSRVRPKPGTTVVARLVPHGDPKTKGILSIIIGVALIAVPGVGIGLIGTGIAATAATIALSAGFVYAGVQSILAPAPTVPFDGDIPTSKQSPALLGQGNEARPYSPVDRQYGRYLRFPAYAAKPYTETVGDETFMRALFDFGYGPLQLTDLKLGETPLDQIDADYNIFPGYDDDGDLEIFTSGVDEQPLAVALVDSAAPTIRTTELDTHEASIDISFPGGIIGFTQTSGSPHPIRVSFQVRYRTSAGPGSWATPTLKTPNAGVFDDGGGAFHIDGMVQGYIAKGISFDLPSADQYDIELSRISTLALPGAENPNPTAQFSESTWSVLRSIRPGTKPRVPNICLVEMRIRLTDQLQGGVKDFNAIATSILPVWSDLEPLGDGWGADNKLSTNTSLQVTRNAAWAFAEHLRGVHNRVRVPNSKLDTQSIAAWASKNDTAGRTFDGVVDFEATIGQVAIDIAANSRASMTRIDGRYGVVVDDEKPVVITHITPRDSSGFKATKVFRRDVHAIRTGFVNASKGYQPDEVIVYADGYDESNATEFDRLDLWGVDNADRAWRDGRYHLANSLLRPELYSINLDVQNLMLTRGDRFRYTNEVMLVGVVSARIKAIVITSDHVIALTLDNQIDLDPEQEYGIRFRTAAGESIVGKIITPTESTTLVVMDPVGVGLDVGSLTAPPAVQDIVTIGGWGQETGDYIVHAIYPGPDLSARVEFVDYSPAVFTADTGEIPPFDPGITDQRPRPLKVPAVPIIDSIASDESVLIQNRDGSMTPRILLGVRVVAGGDVEAAFLQAQFRTADPVGNWSRPASVDAKETSISLVGVFSGATYDVRVRTVSEDNRASAWREIVGHLVVGESTPPPDVEQLFTAPGKLLVWQYADAPRDFAGFRIKHQAGSDSNWQTGILAHDGLVTESQFDASLLPAGPRTIMLKAVDLAGNESVNAAVLIADLGGPAVENIVESYDVHAGGWVGTKTDCGVEGGSGDLVPDTEASLFWRDDSSTFWKDDGDLFWDQGWRACTYEDEWTPDPASIPGRLEISISTNAPAWSIDYRVQGTTQWLRWPGYINAEASTTYEFRLSIAASAIEPHVTAFEFFIDKPDIVEQFEDFIIASSGTVQITPTKTFAAIKQVLVTIQDDGNDARSVIVVDKSDPVNGPEVEAYAADGSTRVAALIDAEIRGY